jgi:hypothetical protein
MTTDTTANLDLDAIRPAADLLIAQLGETVTQVKTHEHPTSGEDFYCLNLVSWLGERMGPVLRRLADEQVATREWKARYDALAAEFTAEVDRLRAERNRLVNERAELRQVVANFAELIGKYGDDGRISAAALRALLKNNQAEVTE